MPIFSENRIAAGHNVALNSLVYIESITPTGDRPFFAPQAYGNYDPGIERTRTDALPFYAGYASITWLFDVLTRKQYEYIYDNWRGAVTIYTRPGRLAYARFNGILRLPKPVETDGKFVAYKKFPVRIIQLEPL